jgi:hypothetical protein
MQNSPKGHNELLEIANPLVQTTVATEAVKRHASENRGTWRITCDTRFWLLQESLQRMASLQQIRYKKQLPHKFSSFGSDRSENLVQLFRFCDKFTAFVHLHCGDFLVKHVDNMSRIVSHSFSFSSLMSKLWVANLRAQYWNAKRYH